MRELRCVERAVGERRDPERGLNLCPHTKESRPESVCLELQKRKLEHQPLASLATVFIGEYLQVLIYLKLYFLQNSTFSIARSLHFPFYAIFS